ncbi:hypothetical protein [Sphaerisporangium corydalis]|uniref:Uncharacterized protein n=1 Tax=Sphaerisporangium corydalis TaxID=1441875 RepID=A0ABV9ELB6_9ACTN|nr:hypothetical protein [Sphaerisporangium corydalis]
MICAECKDDRHDECPGGSWCDCQHRPSDEPHEPAPAWPNSG